MPRQIQKDHYAAYDAMLAAKNQSIQQNAGMDIYAYSDSLMMNSNMNMSNILNPNANYSGYSEIKSSNKTMPENWYENQLPGTGGVQHPAYYTMMDLTGNTPLPYSMENMNSPHMIAGTVPLVGGIGANLLVGGGEAGVNALGYSMFGVGAIDASYSISAYPNWEYMSTSTAYTIGWGISFLETNFNITGKITSLIDEISELRKKNREGNK